MILSPREQEALRRVTRGEKRKEIAVGMGISERTVKHYMTQLYKKLELPYHSEPEQLIIWAYETGFVKPKYME